MGKFSQFELEVIEELTSEITTEIFREKSALDDRARLVYSVCSNENEKDKFSKEQVSKYFEKIKKINKNVAAYVFAIKDNDTLYDIDNIIGNFLTAEFMDEIEQMADQKNEIIDYHYLPYLLKLNKSARKLIDKFVEGVVWKLELSNYKDLQNSIHEDHRDKVIDYIRGKISLEIYSLRIEGNDGEKNYYAYALSLQKNLSKIATLKEQTISEIQNFSSKYDKYIIDNSESKFCVRKSIDYKKFIQENFEYEISQTLKAPFEYGLILRDYHYLDKVDILKSENIKNNILEFAKFVYHRNVLQIINLLESLPTIENSAAEISSKINLELMKIEKYVKGFYDDFKFFDFNELLTHLFYAATLPSNADFNINHYCKSYFEVFSQISRFHDKGMFENEDVYENDDFGETVAEIDLILNNRIYEMNYFDPDYEEEEKLISLNDFLISESTKIVKKNPILESFETILSPEKQTYILEMLEDLGITQNGISILSARNKSAIRGVAEGLLEWHFFPAVSLEKCYSLIAQRISMDYKSKLDFSATSQKFHKKTLDYLKQHPPK